MPIASVIFESVQMLVHIVSSSGVVVDAVPELLNGSYAIPIHEKVVRATYALLQTVPTCSTMFVIHSPVRVILHSRDPN